MSCLLTFVLTLSCKSMKCFAAGLELAASSE